MILVKYHHIHKKVIIITIIIIIEKDNKIGKNPTYCQEINQQNQTKRWYRYWNYQSEFSGPMCSEKLEM